MTEKATIPDRKPYLLRAIYEWICDCDCTPQLLLEDFAETGATSGIPAEFCKEKQLVLNVSPTATRNFEITNDGYVYFDTRFSGIEPSIAIDTNVIAGIFARENYEGMQFATSAPKPAPEEDDDKKQKTPNSETQNSSPFRIVK